VVIREMVRVSRYAVVCSVPAPSPIWWLSTLVRRLVERDSSLWTSNTRYYTADKLRELFRLSGLTNVQCARHRLLGVPFMNTVWGFK
jgi:hypothetical protein